MTESIEPAIQREFKASASVDWVELEYATNKPTQFQWIQAALGLILDLPEGAPPKHVTPVDPGPGKVASKFTFRLYDAHANRFAELTRIMSELQCKFPSASPPRITGIEIALDLRARGQDNSGLIAMTHWLQTGLARRGNPRQYDPDPRIQTRTGRMRFLTDGHRINPQQMLYIGNRKNNDPLTLQAYLKRVDQNQRSIEPSKYSARAEFTLSGATLDHFNLGYLSDLSGYRFEGLAHLLHFRRLKSLEQITEGKDPYFTYAVSHRWVADSDSVTAYPFGWHTYSRDSRTGAPRNRGLPKLRNHSRHTDADDQLNRIVRRKFRDLSIRFST